MLLQVEDELKKAALERRRDKEEEQELFSHLLVNLQTDSAYVVNIKVTISHRQPFLYWHF